MLVRMKKKRADLNEIVFSIAMVTLVVLLILQLFNTNINTLVNNSGIHKLLFKNNADDKTSFSKMDTDPTKTQVNVQMVADQGTLAKYHNEAAGVIENATLDSFPLDDMQKEDLGKFLTVYAESGNTSPDILLDERHTDNYFNNLSYRQFGRNNGVEVDFYNGVTSVTLNTGVTRTFDWAKDKNYDDKYNFGTNSPNDIVKRVTNLEAIKETFN